MFVACLENLICDRVLVTLFIDLNCNLTQIVVSCHLEGGGGGGGGPLKLRLLFLGCIIPGSAVSKSSFSLQSNGSSGSGSE